MLEDLGEDDRVVGLEHRPRGALSRAGEVEVDVALAGAGPGARVREAEGVDGGFGERPPDEDGLRPGTDVEDPRLAGSACREARPQAVEQQLVARGMEA